MQHFYGLFTAWRHFGHSPQTDNISCRGSVGSASALYTWCGVFESHFRELFNMFVPNSAYSVGAELSYLGFSWEGNSNAAQPSFQIN